MPMSSKTFYMYMQNTSMQLVMFFGLDIILLKLLDEKLPNKWLFHDWNRDVFENFYSKQCLLIYIKKEENYFFECRYSNACQLNMVCCICLTMSMSDECTMIQPEFGEVIYSLFYLTQLHRFSQPMALNKIMK